MPRIRTIKPSLWQDEKLARCSMQARLVFIGCMSMSDDEGKLRAAPTLLRSQLFPFDDVSLADVNDWSRELHEVGVLDLYETLDGQRYARIPSWRKHQRLDRITKSEFPDPGSRAPLLERANEQGIRDMDAAPTLRDDCGSAAGRGREGEEEGKRSIDLKVSSPAAPSTSVVVKKASKKEPSQQVVACFTWYCELWGKTGAFALELTTKRARAIEKALKEHGSEKVALAIRGHHTNEWRHEQLNRNDIAVLLRPENIEAGVELAAKAVGARPVGAVATPGRGVQSAGDMGYEL